MCVTMYTTDELIDMYDEIYQKVIVKYPNRQKKLQQDLTLELLNLKIYAPKRSQL